MSEFNYIFTCSLSGVEAPEDEVLPDHYADELGLLPAGWTRITVERRLPNPALAELQQVKAGMVAAMLQQVPAEEHQNARRPVELQISAQFAALEAETEMFLNLKETIFVAPPEWDSVMAREFFDIRKRLGLPVPDDVEAPRSVGEPETENSEVIEADEGSA
jgi:hypothetical protein